MKSVLTTRWCQILSFCLIVLAAPAWAADAPPWEELFRHPERTVDARAEEQFLNTHLGDQTRYEGLDKAFRGSQILGQFNEIQIEDEELVEYAQKNQDDLVRFYAESIVLFQMLKVGKAALASDQYRHWLFALDFADYRKLNAKQRLSWTVHLLNIFSDALVRSGPYSLAEKERLKKFFSKQVELKIGFERRHFTQVLERPLLPVDVNSAHREKQIYVNALSGLTTVGGFFAGLVGTMFLTNVPYEASFLVHAGASALSLGVGGIATIPGFMLMSLADHSAAYPLFRGRLSTSHAAIGQKCEALLGDLP